jgi:hypothetical protein
MIVVIQKGGVLAVPIMVPGEALIQPLINQVNNKCLSIYNLQDARVFEASEYISKSDVIKSRT